MSTSKLPNARRLLEFGSVLCAVLLTVVWIVGTSQPAAQDASDDASTQRSAGTIPLVDMPVIPGQIPAMTAAPIVGAPAVGSCGSLTGPRNASTFTSLPCNSTDAALKIVQIASEPSQCVADVDQRNYQSRGSVHYAGCFDFNWQPKRCIAITSEGTVLNVDCDRRPLAGTTYRPIAFYVGVSNGNAPECPSIQVVHRIRKYNVCVQRIQ